MLRVGVCGDRHGEWAGERAASVWREEKVDLRAGIRITEERAGGRVEGDEELAVRGRRAGLGDQPRGLPEAGQAEAAASQICTLAQDVLDPPAVDSAVAQGSGSDVGEAGRVRRAGHIELEEPEGLARVIGDQHLDEVGV